MLAREHQSHKTLQSSIDIQVPALTTVLAPWRDTTIPIATRGVPPHISLLYPWRHAPLTDQDIGDVRTVIATIAPFQLTLSTLGQFSSSTLFLHIADEHHIRGCMRTLATAFPETPPYAGAFADPIPHLTVAKATTPRDVARMEKEIMAALHAYLPLTIDVDSIVIMEEDDDGYWSNRAIMYLT